MELPLGYLSRQLVREFDKLEPYGPGNEEPLFAARNVELVSGRILGKNANVGKIFVRDEQGNGYDMMVFQKLDKWNEFLEQSFGKAVECYKLAAEKGSRQAQENLGYCYYYGRNMPVDYEKAFHYFALGAFDGHLISLYKIGDMYLNGYYVEKNPVEAFHIFTRCLDTMTDEAAPKCAGPVFLRVGNAFLNGYGTDENPMNALICFQKAETYLYDMVANGDVMYKKSLQGAIDGQAKARAKLADALPQKNWTFDD